MVKKEISKLYRSETNRVIAGVCGGIGEYFDFDPVILRIILVLLAVFGGGGILLYFIAWLVIPTKSRINKKSEDYIKENVEEMKKESQKYAKRTTGRVFLGILFVIIGLSILSENLGFYHFNYIWRFWPVIFIVLGLKLIADKH